jgi:hypothetical protein
MDSPTRKLAQSRVLGALYLLILLVIGAAMQSGCENLKKVPIFNPDARPINRAVSAREVVVEINNQLADAVAVGCLTQDVVDHSFAPMLDGVVKGSRVAESLLRAGDVTGGTTKLDSIAATLKTVRSQLAQIQKEHKR